MKCDFSFYVTNDTMKYYFLSLVFISQSVLGQAFLWEKIEAPQEASFRGLCVVDDKVAWVSGSNGWVGVSSDGGEKWVFNNVKGFEKLDFRSLYAFDERTAIIANAGSPANILRTTDGGMNWSIVFKNDHKDAFLDGIDFWNEKEGLLYGDPINGKMLLLYTNNGGLSWKEIPEQNRPSLEEGEASFAASGTGIRCLPNGIVLIATGGKVSRLWKSEDKGTTWKSMNTPITQGLTMTGMYSLAFKDANNGVVVGGDYEKDTLRTKHIFYTHDGGKTWQPPIMPTRGLRECVEYIDSMTLISTGLPGVDISYDGAKTWKPLSDEKYFHVLRKARKGSLIIAAGGRGRLSVLRQLKDKGQN